MGYPCLYPNCKERRKYPIQLVEHVETDHTSKSVKQLIGPSLQLILLLSPGREVLERMVIRDKMGNILALPPHCIYRSVIAPFFLPKSVPYQFIEQAMH